MSQKSLIDTYPADVVLFLVENLTAVFIVEANFPELFCVFVHYQFVLQLQPARLDILIQVGANTSFNKWPNRVSAKLP